jgi:hypothetical protein
MLLRRPNDTTAPPEFDSPAIDGRIEVVRDGVVAGWTWRPSAPDERIGVRVLVDRREVFAGVADLPRRNLAEAGIGDGCHGFHVRLPPELRDGRAHELMVEVGDERAALPVATKAGRDADGAWAGTTLRPVTAFTTPAAERAAAKPPVPREPVDPGGADTPALIGKRDWLFSCRDRGSLGEEHFIVLLDAFVARRDALRAIGVPYVLAVAPRKEDVYPELLPEETLSRGEDRPVEALSAALRDVNGCEVLDLLPALRDGRRHGALYFRTGTQWNARGAFLTTRALLKEAAKRVPSIQPASIDSVYLVRTTGFRGDLADRPKVTFGHGDLVPVADREGDAWTEEVDEVDVTTLRSQQMPTSAHLGLEGAPAPLLYEIAEADDLPRAVLVGDACCPRLIAWLAEHFRRLVVMRTAEPPLDAIELEMPDVLLHVMSEDALLGAADEQTA